MKIIRDRMLSACWDHNISALASCRFDSPREVSWQCALSKIPDNLLPEDKKNIFPLHPIGSFAQPPEYVWEFWSPARLDFKTDELLIPWDFNSLAFFAMQESADSFHTHLSIR